MEEVLNEMGVDETALEEGEALTEEEKAEIVDSATPLDEVEGGEEAVV